MIVYRLCKSKHKNDLSGSGASLAGGKWNNKGVEMLYACGTRALCTAEVAVHLPLGEIPDEYFLLTIQIPNNVKIKIIKNSELPDNWNSYPYSSFTQKIGDDFIKESKYAVLKVPSAVVQGEYNFLVNPSHKDFRKD